MTQGEKALESDVSHDEAAALILDVQQKSEVLHGFNEDEIFQLANRLSVMAFDEAQTILQQGEIGSWFGILLSGSLRVILPGFTAIIPAGAMVGEMAMWQHGAKRGATMEGQAAGYIATMLVDELRDFVVASPDLGMKLMSSIGKVRVGPREIIHQRRVACYRVHMCWPRRQYVHTRQSLQHAWRACVALLDNPRACRTHGITTPSPSTTPAHRSSPHLPDLNQVSIERQIQNMRRTRKAPGAGTLQWREPPPPPEELGLLERALVSRGFDPNEVEAVCQMAKCAAVTIATNIPLLWCEMATCAAQTVLTTHNAHPHLLRSRLSTTARVASCASAALAGLDIEAASTAFWGVLMRPHGSVYVCGHTGAC